jgi:localization factor PodJL
MSEANGRNEWNVRAGVGYRAEPAYRSESPYRDEASSSEEAFRGDSPFRTEERRAARRDSDEMLDHVSRSETETAEISRKIEEQLRGMARRLDASERSQTESNRVMSKAAVEMNIASREQAQAFDQLGSHVATLAQRLERVERREGAEGLRDAVKALHQGLTRVADQITQTANQSATQISSLAGNVESVASRVGQARQDAQGVAQSLEGRLSELDDRVRTLEKAAQASSGLLDRALEALDARQAAAKDSAADAISRLEETVLRLDQKLENRGPDPALDRRLSGIERTLSDVMARIEPPEKEANPIEESLTRIAERLDALETAQREISVELHKVASAAVKPIADVPPPVTEAAPFGPLPDFELPPFQADIAPPIHADAVPQPHADVVPPPFHAEQDVEPPPFSAVPAAMAHAFPAFLDEPPAAEPPPAFELPAPEEQHASADTSPLPTIDSYLSAARRSAQAAAMAEAEHAGSFAGLHWPSRAEAKEPSKTRPLVIGIVALVAIAVIAGVILSRQTFNQAAPNPAVGALFQKHPVAVKKPAAPAPASQITTAPGSPVAPQTPAVAPPTPAVTIPVTPTGSPRLVPPATHPQQQASIPAVRQPVPVTALDRLSALANAGNPKAELVVGLKYLDGDGVPANDAEATKWLNKAAAAGLAVAQYRLGTLFERGRGAATDPAKAVHWYLAAANQGNRKAMHNLAVAYAEGSGVKKDFAEASRWFSRAANLGLSDSQFNLAVLYERGLGVPQNLTDAYKWYAIAAAQGDIESKARMNAISTQLNAEDRAAAQHAADTFRPAALDARANVAPTMAELTRS